MLRIIPVRFARLPEQTLHALSTLLMSNQALRPDTYREYPTFLFCGEP